MVHVYGIKNCNTVKKALDWLDHNKVAYTFHDFKKEPATEEKLLEWQKEVSWEVLVNKKRNNLAQINGSGESSGSRSFFGQSRSFSEQQYDQTPGY